MHHFLKGPSKKSSFIIKLFILIGLTLGAMTSVAQVSKSQLKQLQKESSLKIITMEIFEVNSNERAIQLKAKLEGLRDVMNCEVDLSNNLCKIIAGFGIQREDVLAITSSLEIKTSNYSEDIRIRDNKKLNSVKKSAGEKESVMELKVDPEEEEKLQRELESNRKIEREIAEKEKQDQKIILFSNDLPDGYPQYQDTGNQVQDDEKYAKAKKEWIKNNPEKYKQIFLNGEQRVQEIPYAEFKNMPAEKQRVIKNNPSKYKIIKN